MFNIFSEQESKKNEHYNDIDADSNSKLHRIVKKLEMSEKTLELRNTNKSVSAISIYKRRIISEGDRERIISKLLEGHSVSAIASIYQIKHQTVNSVYKRYLKIGLIFVKKSGDRRSILTSEMKESLISYVDSDCTKTLQEIADWIKDTYNISVSISTINRALINSITR